MKMELSKKLKKILEMWPNHTAKQIAEELNETEGAIRQYINKMREHGLDIPSKRIRKFDWDKFVEENKNIFNK